MVVSASNIPQPSCRFRIYWPNLRAEDHRSHAVAALSGLGSVTSSLPVVHSGNRSSIASRSERKPPAVQELHDARLFVADLRPVRLQTGWDHTLSPALRPEHTNSRTHVDTVVDPRGEYPCSPRLVYKVNTCQSRRSKHSVRGSTHPFLVCWDDF